MNAAIIPTIIVVGVIGLILGFSFPESQRGGSKKSRKSRSKLNKSSKK